MKKTSRLDYAYAVGRIRALERDLVPREVFLEASGERDFNSALKTIFDAGKFTNEMADSMTTGSLEKFIEIEESGLHDLLSKVSLDERILEILLKDHQPVEALKLAESTGYDFISDYYRHKIDLGNLKVFCRMRYLGLSGSKLTKIIMPGGFLDDKNLIDSFDLSNSEIAEKLYAFEYQDLWNYSIDKLLEEETFIYLERGCEDFLVKYLKKARYINFGPEPIFAYAIAKRKELQLLRLVGIGMMYQIPTEIVKIRISETYV